MTPAPEHWRSWKRKQRAVSFEPGQAANDRRFSHAVLRAAALVATVLAIAAFVWALLSASPEVEHGIAGGTRRMSAGLACWIEAHRTPGRSDRERSGQCLR